MSSSSSSANLKTVMNENTDEHEESDSFHTETFASDRNPESSQVNKSLDIFSTTKHLDDSEDPVAVKTEVDLETNMGSSPDMVTSLFPFICGICDFKVNRISTYLTHFQKHENLKRYLHCCFEMDKTTEHENPDLYFCGACGVKFPSLCTLYSHLVSDEGTSDFVFHGDLKVAHLLCTQSKFKKYHGKNFIGNISDRVNSDTVADNKVNTLLENNEEEREKPLIADEMEKVTTTNAKLPSPPKRSFKEKRKLNRKVDTNQQIRMKKNSVVKERREKKQSDKKIEKSCSKISTRCQSNKGGKKKGLTESEFPCETCGKMMKYRSLKEHRATHENLLHPCDLCDLKFKSKARVQIHKAQVHVTDKKFTCDECGKSFKALAYLKQHSQTHLKERNVQCPVCGKMFLYKNVLRIHLLTHSETKTHHCNICGKGFNRHSDVLIHKEGVHEAVDKYPCTTCDKKFATKDRLRKHRLIHQPPKFSCHFCGKSFVRSENLKTHMKIHVGITE